MRTVRGYNVRISLTRFVELIVDRLESYKGVSVPRGALYTEEIERLFTELEEIGDKCEAGQIALDDLLETVRDIGSQTVDLVTWIETSLILGRIAKDQGQAAALAAEGATAEGIRLGRLFGLRLGRVYIEDVRRARRPEERPVFSVIQGGKLS